MRRKLQGEAPFDFTCHQLLIGAVWLIILAAFELPGKNGSGHGHGENYKEHWWSFCVRSIFPGVSILQYFSVPHRFLQDCRDSWRFLRIPQDSSGFLQDCTIILVILRWRRKILSSPQESWGLHKFQPSATYIITSNNLLNYLLSIILHMPGNTYSIVHFLSYLYII